MHVSDMNAKKDLNAYHRHIATAILVDVKLAGKDDTARKHRHVARSTPGSIIARMDVGVDDP